MGCQQRWERITWDRKNSALFIYLLNTFFCHLQVLFIRYWMLMPIMSRVLLGIPCPNMLRQLVLIDLAGFMSISLKQKQKVLRRWITFVNTSLQRQKNNWWMILRLESIFLWCWILETFQSQLNPPIVCSVVCKRSSLSWWNIAIILQKIGLVAWWIIFSCASRYTIE